MTTTNAATPSTVAEEQVLVVPTELFHALGHFQGFSTEVDKYLVPVLSSDQLSYRPRKEMEEDPSYKQLIPYVLFTHTDAEGQLSLFTYQRGGGGGEARLRAKRSVGVGGHISTLDIAENDSQKHAGDVYRRGLDRELEEEICVETPYVETRVGVINDDETEVGKVHLGIVHRFEVEEPNVAPREDDLVDARFQPIEEVLTEIEHYETWSQIALKALFTSSRIESADA